MTKAPSIAILGGGISGLASAYYLHKKYPNSKICLFEKNSELGGKIHTRLENGFLYETAANGVLSSRNETFDLAQKLGCQIIKADVSTTKRYLMRNGKLNALPKSFLGFIFWKQISPFAKLRLLGDFFCKKSDSDLSINEFAKKHFGKEICDHIINPVCNGIFGSDSNKLSLQVGFPLLYKLRKKYGSVLYGLIKNKPAKSSVILQSFQGGMQNLIDNLHKDLQTKIDIKLNHNIANIEDTTLNDDKNHSQTFDYIISTLPFHKLSKISQDKRVQQLVSNTQYNHMVVVCLGYENYQQDNALGYLVAQKEKSPVLGVLYSSKIFPQNNQDPLFRIILGTEKNNNLMTLTDEQIIKIAQQELRTTLNLNLSPKLVKIIRWKNAIPIYNVNYQENIKKIITHNQNSRFIISGSGAFGISVNDCIKQAQQIVNYIK